MRMRSSRPITRVGRPPTDTVSAWGNRSSYVPIGSRAPRKSSGYSPSTSNVSFWPGVPNGLGVGGVLLDEGAPGLAIAVILRPGPDARGDLAERPRARWCIVRDSLHVTLTRPATHVSKNARASKDARAPDRVR